MSILAYNLLLLEMMIRLELTPCEIDDIAEALDDPEISQKAKLKLMATRLHVLGTTHGHIAVAVNVSADTVTNYCKAYRDGGIGALLENRRYPPVSAAEPFLDQILLDLQAHPVATVKEAAHRIEKISGLTFSETQTRRILKRLGLAYRKTASVPGKADPQLEFAFLQEELLPKLQEAQEGKRRVFFVDAAHFVLGAFLGMIWCLSRVFANSLSRLLNSIQASRSPWSWVTHVINVVSWCKRQPSNWEPNLCSFPRIRPIST